MDPRDLLKAPKEPTCLPVEETEEVEVKIENPKKVIKIGKCIDMSLFKQITTLLREYLDIFT